MLPTLLGGMRWSEACTEGESRIAGHAQRGLPGRVLQLHGSSQGISPSARGRNAQAGRASVSDVQAVSDQRGVANLNSEGEQHA